MRYLTFTKLGGYGRLGNQLWEAAAVIGLAHKYNLIPLIPSNWSYRKYCALPDEFYGDVVTDTIVKEQYHHYNPGFLDGVRGDNIGIEGGFQSPKYFAGIENDIKKWFRPKESLYFGDNSVSVHIRRGDYVGHKCYCQYEIDWFKSAIADNFADPRYMFYVCSDDYKYIQQHFQAGERYILAKRDAIEDFITLVSCRHHILSGSSYSFWSAYLSPHEGIVVRPPRTHTGPLSHLNEDDMWPENFKSYMPQKRVVLVCYADKKYEKFQNRLIETNKNNKQFDEVFIYNREWLETTEFYAQNKELLDQERGGGYWAWKPFIILESLKRLK